jgi:hypothetical protein
MPYDPSQPRDSSGQWTSGGTGPRLQKKRTAARQQDLDRAKNWRGVTKEMPVRKDRTWQRDEGTKITRYPTQMTPDWQAANNRTVPKAHRPKRYWR